MPRRWSELSDAEQAAVRQEYRHKTNGELAEQYDTTRARLAHAAERWPREERLKTPETRRRAYDTIDRVGSSVEPRSPDKARETHRAQAELKELRRLKRSHLDEQVWTHTVIEALQAQIPRLSEVVQPARHKRRTDNQALRVEEHALVLSDIQLGSAVEATETGGLSEFSWPVFQQRAARLESAIRSVNESLYTRQPVQRLNVFGLGDYVDGHNIFKGHPWELDLHVAEQVTAGPHEIAQILARLLDTYESIHFYTVFGNHGRVGQAREAAPTLANWDYIFVRFLELMTEKQRDSAGKRRVTFHYSSSWWQLIERLGFRFLCIHGEDVKSWMSLPYYGFDRARARYTSLIQQHLPRGSGPVTFDMMVAGHHHTPAYISTSSGPILLNGAWPGGSKFSEKVLQSASAPAQWFLGIHEVYGITGLWNLSLSHPDEMREVHIDQQ